MTSPPKEVSLMISNIPPNVTPREIFQFLRPYPGFTRFAVVPGSSSNFQICRVYFMSREMAEYACYMLNGYLLDPAIPTSGLYVWFTGKEF